ncbi:MAG: hypothetical protein GWN89_07600, partial [Thermoplasmata archaeon]|nr:hypothetical protein [Thermoplasmata archaeon]NIT76986.1 hypothetical protein [Thermoplasmata archaeon]NIY03357.1 hypothetical protein [Thermoplasmata archaeon]
PKTGYFAPPLVKNADGQIRAGTPMTKQSIAKFEREVMRQEDINNTEEWAGDIIGVSNDPLTLDALGASVTVDWGYGEMPGYFPTSRQMAAPTAALRRHPELMKYVEEIETIGSQTFFAFRAPEDTTKDLKVKMDSGLFMAWSSKYKVWALRWSEDGAPGVPKGVPSDMYGRTSPEFTTEKPFDGPVTLQEHRDAHKKRQAEERKKREQGYGLEMGYGG